MLQAAMVRRNHPEQRGFSPHFSMQYSDAHSTINVPDCEGFSLLRKPQMPDSMNVK